MIIGSILGMKRIVGVIVISTIIAFVGLFLGYVVLAQHTSTDFVNTFNSVLRPITNSTDSFHQVIASAHQAGFTTPPAAPGPTFVAMGIFGAYWLIWSFWSTYFAGEMKGASNPARHLLAMFMPVLVNVVITVVGIALLYNVIGYDFLGSATWNYYGGTWPTAALPSPATFMGILAGNLALATFIAFSFAFWLIPYAILGPASTVRMMLAWSFDRVLPAKISSVNDRFHTPVLGLVLFWILAEVAMYAVTFVSGLVTAFTMSAISQILFTFTPVAITAIILPIKKPDLFASSPIAKYKVGKVPVLSIAGVVTLFFNLYMAYGLLSYPYLGGTSTPAIIAVLAIWLSGFVVFYVAKAYRSRQGIDLNQVYSQIPPE